MRDLENVKMIPDLDELFAASDDGDDVVPLLRIQLKNSARFIVDTCPVSEERNEAIVLLSDALDAAQASILTKGAEEDET